MTDIPALPIRIAGFTAESSVDGPGLRAVIFVQGCPHHCPGCHNPQTHDPNGGNETTVDLLWAKIARDPLLAGVTFSGGEPFLWAEELAQIGEAAHRKGLHVMTYSGYTWERLQEMAGKNPAADHLLRVTDILIEGPFVLAQRSLELAFRGSPNQRILDLSDYPQNRTPRVIPDDEIRTMRIINNRR